jgi:hypothetical protein
MKKLIRGLARISGLLCLVLTALPAWSAVSFSSPTNNALYLAPASAVPVRANASASGGATVVRWTSTPTGTAAFTLVFMCSSSSN